MKVGIISFAHLHAHSYANALRELDDVEFVGIFDEDIERGKEAAQQYNVPFYKSLDELLSADMDSVIITSENAKHYEHVKAAAEKNIDILCEKPIATTLEDAQAMIAVCEKHNVKLQTAFPVRFNTPVQHAKKAIDDGLIGDILAVKATNRGTNPGGWFLDKELSGGGAVIDHTVHVVDILRWFMQSEVTEVYAEIGNVYIDKPIDDMGLLNLEFDNGVFASLDCSWSRTESYPAPVDVTLQLIGSKGNMYIDAFAQRFSIFTERDGEEKEIWADDMDLELIRDFTSNKTASITGDDGMKALEAGLAAYQSNELGQVVKINK